MATGPHSPGTIRTFPLRNVDAWYEAFGVPGDKQYVKPEESVRIW
jgi:putative endopeptidase